jgi:hypothetical protein
MAKLKVEGLNAIQENLTNFALISGLKCNVDKSMIMIVGTENVPEFVNLSGFQVCNTLRILGFDITKNYKDLTNNFTGVLDKIERMANFWNRYRLSLQGRISVAKTLLLSQIGYIGSIITPLPEQLTAMQGLIDNFVCGTMNISKKMINVEPIKGGLGMINISDYITALQCSWIKRGLDSNIDSWRSDLNDITGENIVNILPTDIIEAEMPINFNISVSFGKFKERFYLTNDNFLTSFIIGNPLIINNKVDKRNIGNEIFLYDQANSDKKRLSKLVVHQFFNGEGEFIDLPAASLLMGIPLSVAQYGRICTAIKDTMTVIKNKKVNTLVPVNLSLTKFLTRFKKGSKKFRNIISLHSNHKIKCTSKRSTRTFFNNINCLVPSEKELEILYGQWNIKCFTVRFRDFVYKFRNNLLGLNTRVAHFNNNIMRTCTFCQISNNRQVPAPDESFYHLFFECPYTRTVLQNFITRFLYDLNFDNERKKRAFFFTGSNPATGKVDNMFLLGIATVSMYHIWECKLKKTIPTIMGLTNEIFWSMDIATKLCRRISEDMSNNLHICRIWRAEASARR